MASDEKVSNKGLSLSAYREGQAALMLPPPPRVVKQKRPKIALDEDTYVASISRIIERDYFPDLVVLKCRNAYLDALNTGDERLAAKLRRRLDRLTAPGGVEKEDERIRLRKKRRIDEQRRRDAMFRAETPIVVDSRAETPRLMSVNGSDSDQSDSDYSGEDENSSVAHNNDSEHSENTRSLEQFQAKFTSEDNESFNEVLDQANQKHRDKHAWLWNGNKLPGTKGIEYLEWQRANRQALMDQGSSPSTALIVPDTEPSGFFADHRPAKVDTWKSKPRNELIFGPEIGKLSVAGEHAARAKEIKKANTRFQDSDTMWNGSYKAAAMDRSATPSVDFSRESTPTVRGYSFIPEPSPSPSEPGTPLRTWESGMLTPNISKFRIPDTPKREELHHRLLSSTKRTSSSNSVRLSRNDVPKFKTGPDLKKVMLTPAGKRLINSIASTKKSDDGITSSSNDEISSNTGTE